MILDQAENVTKKQVLPGKFAFALDQEIGVIMKIYHFLSQFFNEG